MKWAWSDKGEISANKIIVATHFPFLNKNGSYFLKLYQHRSYVLALEGAQNVDGMYMDEMEKGISFRNYKSYLLLGGGSHRTGEKGGNFFSKSKYYETTTFDEWNKSNDKLINFNFETLSTFGLHIKMEPGRTYMGLPLSWVTLS